MYSTLASVLALFVLVNVAVVIAVPSYFLDAEEFPADSPQEVSGDQRDMNVDRIIQGLNNEMLNEELLDGQVVYKRRNTRSCIRRGGRCDHRPDDCCSGGACRCNLWGTNCQCQRMGIFQKWG